MRDKILSWWAEFQTHKYFLPIVVGGAFVVGLILGGATCPGCDS